MYSRLKKNPEPIWPGTSSSLQANFLFRPDTILRFQYFQMHGKNSRIEAEKKLMLAVLDDAIAIYQKYFFAHDEKGKELFCEAEEWIMEEQNDWFFSFTSICEQLEMDPDYLRRGLLHWSEKQICLFQLVRVRKLIPCHGIGRGT